MVIATVLELEMVDFDRANDEVLCAKLESVVFKDGEAELDDAVSGSLDDRMVGDDGVTVLLDLESVICLLDDGESDTGIEWLLAGDTVD